MCKCVCAHARARLDGRMVPILRYLKSDQLLDNMSQARTIQHRTTEIDLLCDCLLRKCLRKTEMALSQVFSTKTYRLTSP